MEARIIGSWELDRAQFSEVRHRVRWCLRHRHEMKAVPVPKATWCSNLKLLKSFLPASEISLSWVYRAETTNVFKKIQPWGEETVVEIRQPRSKQNPNKQKKKKGKNWDGAPEKTQTSNPRGLSNSHLKAHPPCRQTALWLRAWKLSAVPLYMPRYTSNLVIPAPPATNIPCLPFCVQRALSRFPPGNGIPSI